MEPPFAIPERARLWILFLLVMVPAILAMTGKWKGVDRSLGEAVVAARYGVTFREDGPHLLRGYRAATLERNR
jgi:hypothetical protein